MGIPRRLKNYLLFVDGNNFAGKVPELSLPKLKRKMEEFRAGGMDGPVKIDMGNEALEASFTMAEYNPIVVKRFGSQDIKGVLFRFTAAAQADVANGDFNAIEVVMSGRISEIERDKIKIGESADMKVNFEIAYYKESVDGEILIEIDLPNMKYVVNGVDLLEKQRAALGM